eukprot:s2658_g4.t1
MSVSGDAKDGIAPLVRVAEHGGVASAGCGSVQLSDNCFAFSGNSVFVLQSPRRKLVRKPLDADPSTVTDLSSELCFSFQSAVPSLSPDLIWCLF